MISSSQYYVTFFLTFVLVLTLTPLMRSIAIKSNFLDFPNTEHKTHARAVPYLGGISIISGILLATYASLVIFNNNQGNILIKSSIFVPAIILGMVGLVDDRNGLAARSRLLIQIVTAIFTSLVMIATDTIGNPSGQPLLDFSLTVLWIVGITNSINFIDNIDGGASGVIASISLGIFLISHGTGQYLISITSISIVAAMLGFLIWNKNPAKIYMGDAGSLFVGTLLAVLAIRLSPDSVNKVTSNSIPILLFAIPILDTTVALLSRLRRKISLLQGGQDHLAHRLLRQGFSKKQAVYILWTISLLFVTIATVQARNLVNPIHLTVGAVTIWITLLVLFVKSNDSRL